MAYRLTEQDWSACSEGEGGDEGEDGRGRLRRGKHSLSMSGAALLEENKRLYMDNLRLWDCLTVIRGDPTLTCQGAINLVFSLRDDEYMRTFPDTSHLFQLRFPQGFVCHADMEEAKCENSRLKDENARLHAAVWVLRDNASLQADSTVAAIFRLDETQFQAKFHVDHDSLNLGTVKAQETSQYQNNNKARRRSYRSSLDVGNEMNMAIQLSNRPLKVGYSSRRSRSASDRGHHCPSFFSPVVTMRKRSGSAAQQKDFTSNWKATSPCEGEHILGLPGEKEFAIALQERVTPKYSKQPWRRESCFGPLYLCATEGSNKLQDAAKPTQKTSQSVKDCQCTAPGDREQSSPLLNLRPARGSSSYSTASTVKRVYSANSLSNSLPGALDPGTEHIILSDNLGEDLHVSYDQRNHFMRYENRPAIFAREPSTRRGISTHLSLGTRSPSYSTTRLLEPSKRILRDIASNPVLDSCKSLLYTTDPRNFLLFNQDSALTRDIRLLNTSSNNDSESQAKLSPRISSLSNVSGKSLRPQSAKSRVFSSARNKNLLAAFSKEIIPPNSFVSHTEISATHNNHPIMSVGSTEESRRSRTQQSSCAGKENKGIAPKLGSATFETTGIRKKSPDKPDIILSTKPFLPRRTEAIMLPYSLRSYTSVKHFLDRHQKLLRNELLPSNLKTSKTTSPSEESLAQDKDLQPKMHRRGSFDLDVTQTTELSLTATQGSKVKAVQIMTPGVRGQILTDYSVLPVGKLKACDKGQVCDERSRIQTLKQMGTFRYTKPLVAMLERQTCHQWQPATGTPCQTAAAKLAESRAHSLIVLSNDTDDQKRGK